jgi:hypothetical protein
LATIRSSYYEPFACKFGGASREQSVRVSHRVQALVAMFAYLPGVERLFKLP